METLKRCTKTLAAGDAITPADAAAAMKEIMAGTAPAPLVGAYLTALKVISTSLSRLVSLSLSLPLFSFISPLNGDPALGLTRRHRGRGNGGRMMGGFLCYLYRYRPQRPMITPFSF